jgi:hypothetical protein
MENGNRIIHGAYILTAIAIPLETRWVPHSWSFYETSIVTGQVPISSRRV